MVEAVRVGTILAHDAKAARRWRDRTSPRKRSLTGAALEAAVMRIAAQFPENVIRAGA